MPASSTATKILVVLNGKGGVGKTTTAVSLAAALSESAQVLLVDTDPQGSATWWTQRNPDGVGFEVQSGSDPHTLKSLRRWSPSGLSPRDRLRQQPSHQRKLIVVDTPPALNSDALRAVIPAADYLVLPTPPAPMDLATLIDTVRTTVTPAGVPHRVLLTRVDPRSLREALDAQNTLMELGIPAFHAFVRSYKAHERAALEGQTITQWHGKYSKEAKADYYRVVDEIQRDWES